MDVIKKLKDLKNERGWSEYRLAKESGLPISTISNIFHRNSVPSVRTIESLCNAFGITLTQFFLEGSLVSLTEEQEGLLEIWARIGPEQREALLKFLKTMESGKDCNK